MDGNSPAAGAVADGETFARTQAMGLDPSASFRQSDAYTFFNRLDDAIVIGPSGNNLRDLRLLLADPWSPNSESSPCQENRVQNL
jgi:hydroxypyruvate reductase